MSYKEPIVMFYREIKFFGGVMSGSSVLAFHFVFAFKNPTMTLSFLDYISRRL